MQICVHRNYIYIGLYLQSFLGGEAGSKQITEEGEGMIELHLLVVEGKHKCNGTQQVMTLRQSYHSPKG